MCIDQFLMDFPRGKKLDHKRTACSLNSLSEGDRKQPSMESQHQTPPNKKRPSWRKPKDMPKRPLSAYNLFFADERKELLKVREGDDNDLSVSTFPDTTSWQSTESQQQKLGFAGLARTIAAKWKTLDAEKKHKYEKQAEVEKLRYQAQMKEYNEQRLKAQQQATVATTSDHTGSSPIWPAMPQTIASLGNIYDTTSEQPLPGSGLVPFEGMAASASGLVMPKGSFFGTRPDSFPPALAMDSSDRPADTLVFPQRPHQQEAKRIRRVNSAGPSSNTTSMVLWNEDTALARRLSSPGNISILAAELGQDQVDFFLRSLRENQDEEEGANQT